MSAVEDRLAELGLALPEPVAPVAAYVPAVATGNLLWISGQVPFVDGAPAETGKVGESDGLVSPLRARECAAICALNALAAAKAELGDLGRVTRVVKLVGFVASSPDFTGQPGVVNGASELLGDVFGESGRHARSAVGVYKLPLNFAVEVDAVIEVAERRR